jgi:hypothetical protein
MSTLADPRQLLPAPVSSSLPLHPTKRQPPSPTPPAIPSSHLTACPPCRPCRHRRRPCPPCPPLPTRRPGRPWQTRRRPDRPQPTCPPGRPQPPCRPGRPRRTCRPGRPWPPASSCRPCARPSGRCACACPGAAPCACCPCLQRRRRQQRSVKLCPRLQPKAAAGAQGAVGPGGCACCAHTRSPPATRPHGRWPAHTEGGPGAGPCRFQAGAPKGPTACRPCHPPLPPLLPPRLLPTALAPAYSFSISRTLPLALMSSRLEMDSALSRAWVGGREGRCWEAWRAGMHARRACEVLARPREWRLMAEQLAAACGSAPLGAPPCPPVRQPASGAAPQFSRRIAASSRPHLLHLCDHAPPLARLGLRHLLDGARVHGLEPLLLLLHLLLGDGWDGPASQ